jgi:beta-glucanase (GH16 family)
MKALEFFDKWDIVLDENFTEKELNTERWQPENWWGFKMTGSSFSQEGEMQSFHGVRNIEIRNNRLSLLARKEKVMGKVWNPGVGLVPRQHDYSSSILNTADSFRIREGVIEAKVRFKKDSTIISAFSLTGEKPFPQIDLFRSNKEGVGMGILEKHHHHSDKYLNLKGLKDDHFHIYRLEVFNNELVWKINDHEVFRSSLTIREPMFFNLLTSLHGKVNEQLLPHQFEIDWIRCFALKA